MRTITKLRLLSILRRLLAKPDTKVVDRKLRVCGHSEWTKGEVGPEEIKIFMDSRRDGRVRLVIHELLHIWFDYTYLVGENPRPPLTYELEEAMILAWEAKLYAWLHSPKRVKDLESWNKAIERKMR